MSETVAKLVEKARRAIRAEDTLVALMHLEAAVSIDPRPGIKSLLAYCLVKERRQVQRAMQLCREALKEDPTNPEHFYQLGRIYLLTQQKNKAIAAFRKGLKQKRHQPIINELSRLGLRKEVVFDNLPREHFLNRAAGLLLTRVGAR